MSERSGFSAPPMPPFPNYGNTDRQRAGLDPQPPSYFDAQRWRTGLTPSTGPTPYGSVSRSIEPSESSMDKARMKSRLIERDGLFCVGCDRWFDHERYLELDHEVPKSRSGSDDIRNWLLLCHPCNRDKGNTLTLRGLREKNLADGDMAPSLNHNPAWVRVGRSGKMVKGDYTIIHTLGGPDDQIWRVKDRDALIGRFGTRDQAIAFAQRDAAWAAWREATRYSSPST